MKKDVANFVAKCLECQLVKAEHGHPARLLLPHNIRESKWEAISMDFIVELPETTKRHNSILVVVDKLTKSAHFIPVRDTYKSSEIAQVFIKEVVILHGCPKKIISDRASIFTGRFWTSFQGTLLTQLNFSTAYHLETDDQTERVNQVLEDMLRITPLSWDRLEDKISVGLEILQEIEEQVCRIRKILKQAQDRQKSYADMNSVDCSFKEGEFVFLRVKHQKSSIRFGKDLSSLLNLLGLLRSSKGLELWHIVLLYHQSFIVTDERTLKAELVCILGHHTRHLRRRMVDQMEVQWDPYSPSSATWEDASSMRLEFPFLFS
eukprot:PITA_07570